LRRRHLSHLRRIATRLSAIFCLLHDPPTPVLYTLSLHDALPIYELPPDERATYLNAVLGEIDRMMGLISELLDVSRIETNRLQRSEEHTSELQSLAYLVCRLLLEKKKQDSHLPGHTSAYSSSAPA